MKLIAARKVQRRKARDSCLKILAMEEASAGEVLRRLEARVLERGLKLTELFAEIDRSGDGSIDGDELAAMMKKMTMASTEVRVALARREREHRQKVARDNATRVERQRTRERLAHAEATGATRAMHALDDFLRAKGLRLKTLFQNFLDTSGDELVDTDELQAGLVRAGLEMPRAEVAALVAHLDSSGDGSLDISEVETTKVSVAHTSRPLNSTTRNGRTRPPRHLGGRDDASHKMTGWISLCL